MHTQYQIVDEGRKHTQYFKIETLVQDRTYMSTRSCLKAVDMFTFELSARTHL
jgi:hypothetical protein